jgi:hypothetical protein
VKEDIAKALEHIAAGLRDDTFELGNIEMTQSAMPSLGASGSLEYKPTGEFTLVMTYKRKEH